MPYTLARVTDGPTYAREGNILSSGSALAWIAQTVGLPDVAELTTLAAKVPTRVGSPSFPPSPGWPRPTVPPREALPESVLAAYDARDDAMRAEAEHQLDYAHLLADSWEADAQRIDEQNAYEAAKAGRPMPKKSTYEEWAAARPRALGVLRALEERVDEADRALLAAVKAAGADGKAAASAELDAAGEAWMDAEKAVEAARVGYNRRLWLAIFWTEAARGDTPSFADSVAAPRIPGGPNDPDALPATATVRAYREALGQLPDVPQRMTVSSTHNGPVFSVRTDAARSLLAAGDVVPVEEPVRD